MADFYTEEQIIATVSRLTRVQLVHFIEADVIRPLQTETGPRFRPMDVPRLELLCDLTEEFGLRDDDVLGMVVSLIDQLHAVRADLEALTASVAAEPKEIRDRIGEAFLRRRR